MAGSMAPAVLYFILRLLQLLHCYVYHSKLSTIHLR